MRPSGPILRRLLPLATLFDRPLPLLAITPADEPLVKVVEKVRPAVVNISTEKIVQRQVQSPYDALFGRYYSFRQAVPSLGSGILISADGYIVTCAHVVGLAEDKQKIEVSLSDGSRLPATLVTSDDDADLALLKVDRKDPFPFISAASADLSPNLLGQTVIAVGDPVGFQSSVSSGILSAKERKVRTADGESSGLQTDAAINPGNSGGALVDIEGKLVGVCNAKLSGVGLEGIGFGIPGERVAAWLTDAIAIAKGEKPAPKPVLLTDVLWDRFGVRFQDITPDLARTFGLRTTNGMLVAGIDKGSPAEKVGMAPGMVLVRIGNVSIYNSSSLPRELRGVKPGDFVPFTMAAVEQRGDQTLWISRTVPVQAR